VRCQGRAVRGQEPAKTQRTVAVSAVLLRCEREHAHVADQHICASPQGFPEARYRSPRVTVTIPGRPSHLVKMQRTAPQFVHLGSSVRTSRRTGRLSAHEVVGTQILLIFVRSATVRRIGIAASEHFLREHAGQSSDSRREG